MPLELEAMMSIFCILLALASLLAGGYLALTHSTEFHALIAFQAAGFAIVFLLLSRALAGPRRVRV